MPHGGERLLGRLAGLGHRFGDRLARLGVRRAGLVLFVAVLGTYVLSPVTNSFDSMWTVPTAASILHEGDTDLDEYPRLIAANDAFGLERLGGHRYSFYPVAPALFAVPVVALVETVLLAPNAPGAARTLGGTRVDVVALSQPIERLVASLLVALAALVLFSLARESLRPWRAALVAAIFAFGTSAWSMASRGLWQHGPSMLMLALALWLLVRGRRAPRFVPLVGLVLAAAYVIRPTNAVSVALLGLYVLVAYGPRIAGRTALWALPVALPFVAYNLNVYGALLPTYFAPGRLAGGPNATALVGLLLSPGRGLLVYSPVVLLAAAGVIFKLRARAFTRLDAALLVIVFAHWLVSGSGSQWWGGHCYGPRQMSDMFPYLIYFLIPVVAALGGAPGAPPAHARPRQRRLGLGLTCGLLVALSVFIQARGALAVETLRWNVEPTNVDTHRSRLWDWSDAPFMRGLTDAVADRGRLPGAQATDAPHVRGPR